jgi:hypothetical protein
MGGTLKRFIIFLIYFAFFRYDDGIENCLLANGGEMCDFENLNSWWQEKEEGKRR